MTIAEPTIATWSRLTRLAALTFRAKATVLQLQRAGRDLAGGIDRHAKGDGKGFDTLLARSVTPLWSDQRPEEAIMQLGKVQNLRRAARLLHGVVVPAGAVFSFWRQIGRTSRRRGFVDGRMLQQGCLVPAMGGGLCQLSNALYEVALQSGAEIVERHAHSRVVPGSAAAFGRDATVAWNYIDLRFRLPHAVLVEARLERDALVIALHGRTRVTPTARRNEDVPGLAPPLASSCASCGDTSCFRHEAADARPIAGRTAYLLDACWPEFRDHVARERRNTDILGLPLDGGRWSVARYRWDTRGFARVGTASLQTLWRAAAMRRRQHLGAERLVAELAAAERLARKLSGLLTADVTRVCVAQSLLPFLWRDGHLGGRSFSVLATRPPMQDLHRLLDAAARTHPESPSLSEFRAPEALAAAEAEAFAQADRIVTPHADIARRFADRALRLDWRLPEMRQVAGSRPRRVAFPGPTIARKGAWELRAAARQLDLEIVLLGSELEGSDFWRGVRTTRAGRDGAYLQDVAAVVHPALIEEQPRRLLAALAAGVPVIATPACGIPARAGLTLVPPGDVAALTAALEQLL